MNYTDAEEYYWFVQFQSADSLRRMCALLEGELEEGHVECPSKDDAARRLDELACRMFPAACRMEDAVVELSVAGQLKDWWKEKKKGLKK